MSQRPKHIVIIQGHPNADRPHFCHALADAYTAGAGQADYELETIDVASLEFPLIRSRGSVEHCAVPEAIRRAQRVLGRSDHIVLIFPVVNGAMPMLLTAFLEQTLTCPLVCPNAESDDCPRQCSPSTPRKTLAGRTGRIVATMEMPASDYGWYLHPEKRILRQSGVSPVQETLIGLVQASNPRRRERWLRLMRTLGRRAR